MVSNNGKALQAASKVIKNVLSSPEIQNNVEGMGTIK